MSRNPTTTREISYTSKDFDSIKSDLVSYLKRYFPNTIQDFSDVSGGMAIVDLMAYLGDVLNFQIDRSVNESFLTRAVERRNIVGLAKSLGYKPNTGAPAIAKITATATFLKSSYSNMTFSILPGTRIVSSAEPANFELSDTIDFSSSKNRSVVSDDGTYITYSVSGATAVAGRTKTFSYVVSNNPKKFLSVILPDRNVTEVVSVIDSEGTEFVEVDNLAQSYVYAGDSNIIDNDDDIDYSMKIRLVPNRYVVETDSQNFSLVRFGAGDAGAADSEKILNPEELVLPNKIKGYSDAFSAPSVDLSSFLNTASLGNLPKPGSIVYIKYRIGSGLETNVGANNLNKLIDTKLAFKNPDAESNSGEYKKILSSITINNPTAAYGGEDAESNNSIKQNAIRNFAAQDRCVTLLDYKMRASSMPPEYGRIFRVTARKDPYKNSGIELITLCRNSSGHLQYCSDLLKNNLEKYLKPFKGVSDSIRISDGNIMNIGVNFAIYPAAGYNKDKALLDAMFLISSSLSVRNLDFGMSLSMASLINLLQNQDYIAAVPFFKIINLTGGSGVRQYSGYSENIDGLNKNNVIKFKQDVIPELKYPNFDIQGSLA